VASLRHGEDCVLEINAMLFDVCDTFVFVPIELGEFGDFNDQGDDIPFRAGRTSS
jgi:hypothetical protein